MKRRAGLLITTCLMVLAGSASSLLASSGPLRVGAAPRLPAGSAIVGSLASDTQIGAAVTLQPRDPAALAAYATAVSTPGSGQYRDYLTVSEFAQRFGPTQAQISAVEASLRSHGLTPGTVTANGLAIPVTATSAQLAQAFSTTFERVRVSGGRIAFANTSAPEFDASVAGDVQGVVGLDSLTLPRPEAHGVLVTLRTVEPAVQVTLSHPAISASKDLVRKIKHKPLTKLSLLAAATNTGSVTTVLPLKLQD